MASTKIGNITHYYPKIGVAVLELVSTLNIGDSIKFSGSSDFTQTVDSMQIEHEPITTAKKGQIIGLKVNQPVNPGDIVSKA